VLATVKGDVHDIGKNLVDIILTNNGYEVHNIGIKISIAEMIEKALEVNADAIGMSGLLVKSTLIMRDNLEELNARDLPHPGAARRRRPHPLLRRARPARGLRRPPVLRQGRLRGPPGHGPLGEIRRDPRPTTPTAFGSNPSESTVPPAPASTARPVDHLPARSPEVETDNRGVRPAVPRQPHRQGHPARRHRRLPQRDGPLPQPVGLPPRGRRGRRRVQGAPAPCCASSLAKARADDLLVPQVVYGYFPANGDGTTW
jgi:5-methyltetrahydrofolate--homocysteine methyltransferase